MGQRALEGCLTPDPDTGELTACSSDPPPTAGEMGQSQRHSRQQDGEVKGGMSPPQPPG